MKKQLLLAAALLAAIFSFAQQTFTKEQLLKNQLPKDFYNSLPQVLEWLDDEHVVLNTKQAGDAAARPYVMEVKTGTLTAPAADYKVPSMRRPEQPLFIKDNNIFLRSAAGEKQLTFDAAPEKNPTFSPDEKFVAFTRNNDLYTVEVATGKETRLTTDGTDLILNGYASWVYWEEIFGRPTAFRAFWWSPDSKTLAYMRFDQSRIKMFQLYNADGTHGSLEETRYPKAGDPNPDVKLGFVQATGGATTWVDFNSAVDHQLGWPEWKPDGSALYVQWQNRGQDSLRLFAVNPKDASKKEVYFETQKAWISLDEADGRLTFINGGADMIIMSDKSGWKHYSVYSSDGVFKNNITSGNYTVQEVLGLDEKTKTLYIRVRGKDGFARSDVYSVSLDGKKMTRLTFGNYNHSRSSFSPSYKYLVTSYNSITDPGGMAIVDNKGKLVRELGKVRGAAMSNFAMAKTELIFIKSADGKYDLPAVVTWPMNFDPTKKYPMLVNVYGGPDASQVTDAWQWNGQRQWYAQEGLLQVTFDNRASGHFGKAAIAEIHRQLGILEIEDFKTMAKYFIDKGYADPAKVCITGFSFGGYMSCMALTYASDVFTHGMAGGSVTDWHLYDSHYTERFMDTPGENPDGYKKTSVMQYVDRYKGMLQIVHGTMDDNVHMQNSIQLIGALQDKGKDFEFMLYPNGRHGWGFMPARNNHFTNLKTKFIYKYLLEKEVPKEILR